MSTVDDSHSELSSDEFRRFCVVLNSLRPDPNARSGFDGMSGGFKFADEFADEFWNLDVETLLRLIGWLRRLWGYRISLILGVPRAELADWWLTTKRLAPNWPGFLLERCDSRMRPVADSCCDSARELTRDLDRMDEEFRHRQSLL